MAKSTKILKEGEEEQPRKFSNEVKKHFLEIVSTYNKYQEAMDRKSDLTQIAETLGGIVEAAQQLAVNEADDWFDKHTVKRNMGELSKLGKEFDKFAIEAKALDQRLSGLYEDMGHILSRYYKLGDISENEMKTRLGVNESINTRFGDWSVTREDANSIKLVNQETMDDILVHKTDNSRLQKYETSYKKRRIIQPSLKKLMDSVIKLDESKKSTIGESIVERYVAPAVASRNGDHPVGFSIFVKSKGYPTKELPKLYKTKSEADAALKKMGVNEATDSNIYYLVVNQSTGKKEVKSAPKNANKTTTGSERFSTRELADIAAAKANKKSSLAESAMSELDIMANEARDFRDFTKEVYKEYPTIPKNSATVKWLEDIYKNRTNESINEGGDRYNIVDNNGKVIEIDLPKPIALKFAAKKKGWKIQSAKSPNESITEALNEYDEWRNTKIQAKNIFRMLKQKYNNVPDMKKGLEDILKQNKTKDDQAQVMWDEFNTYFKIKESVNERKEFPSKEELVAYMVKGGHNKDGAKRVVDQNYDYVKKYYQGSGLPVISDVLWTVNENFTPQDIEMIKKVVDKEKKLIGLSKIFDKMGWHTDFVMLDSIPPHLKIRKKKNDKQYYLLVNKRYVDKPDWVSGEIAGGLDESVEKKNLIVNESLTPGDKLQHKHNPNISIELVNTTNRGWKVKQFDKNGNRTKEKTAFYDSQDISGDRSIFKPVNESIFSFTHSPDAIETFLDKLRKNQDIIRIAIFYKRPIDDIVKLLKTKIKVFRYNNGSPKKIALDFIDKGTNLHIKQSEIFPNNESVNEEDFIPGGLAKGKSIEDIANKHNVSIDELVAQFKKGIAVEMEHTTDTNIAKEISLDHLFEDPKYYDKLSTIENVTEALHGYATATGGYMDKHKDEYKLAKQLLKKAGGMEIAFYDELEDLHTKLGHPKYMIWLSNALRGYKVDMYKDPKIKNKAEAEEALYILSLKYIFAK